MKRESMCRRRHFQTWHFEQDLFSRLLKERREEKPFHPFLLNQPKATLLFLAKHQQQKNQGWHFFFKSVTSDALQRWYKIIGWSERLTLIWLNGPFHWVKFGTGGHQTLVHMWSSRHEHLFRNPAQRNQCCWVLLLIYSFIFRWSH